MGRRLGNPGAAPFAFLDSPQAARYKAANGQSRLLRLSASVAN
jgi:hypothetical protein